MPSRERGSISIRPPGRPVRTRRALSFREARAARKLDPGGFRPGRSRSRFVRGSLARRQDFSFPGFSGARERCAGIVGRCSRGRRSERVSAIRAAISRRSDGSLEESSGKTGWSLFPPRSPGDLAERSRSGLENLPGSRRSPHGRSRSVDSNGRSPGGGRSSFGRRVPSDRRNSLQRSGSQRLDQPVRVCGDSGSVERADRRASRRPGADREIPVSSRGSLAGGRSLPRSASRKLSNGRLADPALSRSPCGSKRIRLPSGVDSRCRSSPAGGAARVEGRIRLRPEIAGGNRLANHLRSFDSSFWSPGSGGSTGIDGVAGVVASETYRKDSHDLHRRPGAIGSSLPFPVQSFFDRFGACGNGVRGSVGGSRRGEETRSRKSPARLTKIGAASES